MTPHIRASFVYWQLYLLYIWIGRIKVPTATLAESEIDGGAYLVGDNHLGDYCTGVNGMENRVLSS